MTRINELRVERVEFMPGPGKREQGVLYVSERFGLAIHLCACGWCGEATVMPFEGIDPWTKTETPDGRITFRPSVGNNQMPCRSHYYVTENRIDWLDPFGPPRPPRLTPDGLPLGAGPDAGG